jgi:uncharacterized protein YheU (UPF0270 family)
MSGEIVEKEAARESAPAKDGKIEELAKKKIENIRSQIAAGRTVLVNEIPVKTIELVKGKRSYYVVINEGQKDEMVIYISEFVRRPVKTL